MATVRSVIAEILNLIFTENAMLAIEPTSDHRSDEELGPVGVGASIGHGQKARLLVLDMKVLV
jgi:hypothetical protein